MASNVVTVPGASGGVVTLSFASASTASLAQSLLKGVYTAAASGNLTVGTLGGSVPPASTGTGAVNEFLITSAPSGAITVPAGYNVVVDNVTSPITVTGNNTPNELFVLGDGSTAVIGGGTGSGTILGGAGADTFGGGNFLTAGSATFTDFITTTGTVTSNSTVDLGVGTAGSPTAVTVSGSGNTIFGGPSGSSFITINATANTVVAGAGSTTISASAGSGGGLYFNSGGFLTFFSAGSDTVGSSGSGGITQVFGGTGSSFYNAFGGTLSIAATNTGPSTSYMFAVGGQNFIFGQSGANMELVGTGSGNVLVAGAGAETLNAAFATGNNSLVLGSGQDLVFYGQTGSDVVFAGSGAGTITSALASPTSSNNFFFAAQATSVAGGGTAGADLIGNFTSTDVLTLFGYGVSKEAAAIAAATVSGGSLVVTLPDKTTITIAGITSLSSSQVVTS